MTIYRNIARSDYDLLPGAHWSTLKDGLGHTAAHIEAAMRGRKDSQAMKFGRAYHHWILQPVLKGSWKVAKGATTTLFDCLTDQEREHLDAMELAIRSLGLRQIENQETAITWEIGGVSCRGLIDGTIDGLLMDLKSTRDASPDAFAKEILRMKYHAQLAFYYDGMLKNDYKFDEQMVQIVAGEKAPPYSAGCYTLDQSWLDLGRTVYENALAILAAKTGPNYGIHRLELPEWAEKECTVNENGGIDL